MTHKILIPQGALTPALQARLEAKFDACFLPNQPAERDAWLAVHGKGIIAMATNAKFGASPSLVAALPDLKVISSLGVGLDAFDLPALKARGIQVGYTPEVLNDCVADIAFALLMAVTRKITEADTFVRSGSWPSASFPMGTRVSGKRLGILGMGRIGSVIARRATGFDMEVRYHNRRAVPGSALAYAESPVALAEWADFLVVASAGGADSKNLVSAAVLDALGPQGFLINVSRGSVVDEPVLIRYLQQGLIAGAGLDVFAQEPQVPADMVALKNVVLLPHIASHTVETREAMANRVVDNVEAFFQNRPLPSAA
ncbi:2-hydroxyacid dehydrogenase [Xylophilus sp. GOD-11R]|uniref:2-hydroxyacid dehydrogenase n=1 Tax=Xylophilus sp. GOD-11R TaxID=3089814 RepID=UPI00298C6242|nr:2-hydroxyacid dehydrogenase [Xylophilus sp. GOD-11R]WPB57175.1 2-hydroxyacid dehydrogenase [Xylophilus sp. GOD-11R]